MSGLIQRACVTYALLAGCYLEQTEQEVDSRPTIVEAVDESGLYTWQSLVDLFVSETGLETDEMNERFEDYRVEFYLSSEMPESCFEEGIASDERDDRCVLGFVAGTSRPDAFRCGGTIHILGLVRVLDHAYCAQPRVTLAHEAVHVLFQVAQEVHGAKDPGHKHPIWDTI